MFFSIPLLTCHVYTFYDRLIVTLLSMASIFYAVPFFGECGFRSFPYRRIAILNSQFGSLLFGLPIFFWLFLYLVVGKVDRYHF